MWEAGFWWVGCEESPGSRLIWVQIRRKPLCGRRRQQSGSRSWTSLPSDCIISLQISQLRAKFTALVLATCLRILSPRKMYGRLLKKFIYIYPSRICRCLGKKTRIRRQPSAVTYWIQSGNAALRRNAECPHRRRLGRCRNRGQARSRLGDRARAASGRLLTGDDILPFSLLSSPWNMCRSEL